MNPLKKFFVHYGQLLIGNGLTILFGLFSFPILTRILSREEYGIVGLISTTFYFVLTFGKGGLSDGMMRYYHEYASEPEKRSVFSSTLAIRGLLLSALAVSIYLAALPSLRRTLSIDPRYGRCFAVMAVSLFLFPLKLIVFNFLRLQGKIALNIAMGLLGNLLALTFSILFFKIIFGNIFGYFIGLVAAEVLVSALLFGWFLANYSIHFRRVSGELALKLMKFGFPLIFSELVYLFLTYIDRYMIAYFKDADSLGLYSVGFNLASYISNLIMLSLSYAVIPIYVSLFEKEGREKTEEFLQNCVRYLLIAVFAIFFGFLAVSKDLFVLVASEKYASAAAFSPILLAGLICLGINNIFNAGLYLARKTLHLVFILFCGLLVNVSLNLYLIPHYGLTGAAVSTLLACLTTSILTVWLSFRHLAVRVDFMSVLFYSALAGIMFGIIESLDLTVSLTNLFLKIAIGIIVYATGVLWREKEMRGAVIRTLHPTFSK